MGGAERYLYPTVYESPPSIAEFGLCTLHSVQTREEFWAAFKVIARSLAFKFDSVLCFLPEF